MKEFFSEIYHLDLYINRRLVSIVSDKAYRYAEPLFDNEMLAEIVDFDDFVDYIRNFDNLFHIEIKNSDKMFIRWMENFEIVKITRKNFKKMCMYYRREEEDNMVSATLSELEKKIPATDLWDYEKDYRIFQDVLANMD